MSKFVSILTLFITMNATTLFDFNENTDLKSWRVVDDVVMGGESSGNFSINESGHGVFSGTVSLENNGGFSSLRHRLATRNVSKFKKAVLKIKGDGKDYQFRVKSNTDDYYSYVKIFSTSGEWEEVEILFEEMYPSFRGRKLNRENFQGDQIEEITFMIANKKNEEFELLIDHIHLK